MVMGRDCSFRNWSVYQDRGPRWVGPHVPNTSQHRSDARFQISARNAKTRSVESVQQCQKILQKQSSGGRSLPRPLRNKLETLAQRVEVLWTAFADPVVHKRMMGNFCLTCSVDVASWQRQQVIWVFVAMCSTQSLVPGMT